MNFIDENCLVFDNEEENKLAYTEVHGKFVKVIDDLLEGVIKELGITQEQFVSAVEKGRTSQEHKKVFDQLFACDNFISFKKLMVKRNQELESEAMKMIHPQSSLPQQASAPSVLDNELNQAKQRTEKADLEHALAVSAAIEEERKAAERREAETIQQVLKLSQLEYDQYTSLLKQQQISQSQQMQYPQQPAQNMPMQAAQFQQFAPSVNSMQAPAQFVAASGPVVNPNLQARPGSLQAVAAPPMQLPQNPANAPQLPTASRYSYQASASQPQNFQQAGEQQPSPGVIQQQHQGQNLPYSAPQANPMQAAMPQNNPFSNPIQNQGQVPMPVPVAINQQSPQVPMPVPVAMNQQSPQVPQPVPVAVNQQFPQVPTPVPVAMKQQSHQGSVPLPVPVAVEQQVPQIPAQQQQQQGVKVQKVQSKKQVSAPMNEQPLPVRPPPQEINESNKMNEEQANPVQQQAQLSEDAIKQIKPLEQAQQQQVVKRNNPKRSVQNIAKEEIQSPPIQPAAQQMQQPGVQEQENKPKKKVKKVKKQKESPVEQNVKEESEDVSHLPALQPPGKQPPPAEMDFFNKPAFDPLDQANKPIEKPQGETLKQRQERLRAQRDLLLKKKQAQRNGELEDFLKETGGAKIAKPGNEPLPDIQSKPEEGSSKRLERYQTLAKDIKTSMTGNNEEEKA